MSDSVTKVASKFVSAGIKEITKVVIREYRDNGQTKAHVEWIDHKGKKGTTVGDPESTHMKALIDRAKREKVKIERDKWGSRSAAKKIDPQDLKEIQKLTQANDHIGADVLRAMLLGARKLERKLLLVKQLVDLEGSRKPGLSAYADALHDAVMELGKRDLSPEDFAEFRR